MIEKKPTPLLQKIFELRKSKKISLKQLGQVLKVKTATASQIENGETSLKAEYLPAVAKLLGVKTWQLFEDYQKEEIGPLSKEEKTLIQNFRKISNKGDLKAIKDLFKQLVKSVP